MNPPLELRDIHMPAEPAWWPPAPGWWLLALLLVIAAVLLARWIVHRVRTRRRLARLLAAFDAAAAIGDPGERVAAISQLLRRAARLRDPQAAHLRGEAWPRFLQQFDAVGTGSPATSVTGEGAPRDAWRILVDGPYRPQADAAAADALVEPARRCFRQLVASP